MCPVNAIKTLQDIAPLSSLDALGSGLIDEISLKSNNFLTSLVSIEKLVSTTPKIIDLLDKFNQFVDSESVQVKDINTYYTTCQAIRKRANVTTTPLLRLNKVMKKEDTEIESFVRKNMTIGIIHLSGNMMRGNGTFGSTAISNAFMTAGADESIDAIVFRIG